MVLENLLQGPRRKFLKIHQKEPMLFEQVGARERDVDVGLAGEDVGMGMSQLAVEGEPGQCEIFALKASVLA